MLDITGLFEAAPEAVDLPAEPVGRPGDQHADDRQRRLLRPRGKRAKGGQDTDKSDDVTALHSMTSSAWASSEVPGIDRLSM